MPCGIVIANRIIEHIAIAIERLWICYTGHDRIRAQESAQFRRIKTRAIVIDPQPRHLPLTGEQLVGVDRARRPTSLTVGIVFLTS